MFTRVEVILMILTVLSIITALTVLIIANGVKSPGNSSPGFSLGSSLTGSNSCDIVPANNKTIPLPQSLARNPTLLNTSEPSYDNTAFLIRCITAAYNLKCTPRAEWNVADYVCGVKSNYIINATKVGGEDPDKYPFFGFVGEICSGNNCISSVQGGNAGACPSPATPPVYPTNRKAGLVVLRGTEGIDEWLEEAHLYQANFAYGNGKVADGFNDIFDQIFPQIELATLSYTDITVMGHSMGAALCVLVSSVLSYKYPNKNITGYAFACPRTGDILFQKWIEGLKLNLYNIMNTADIVPHIPPQIKGTKSPPFYTQSGKIMAFSNNTGVLPDNHQLVTYFEGLPRIKWN
jgi:hypothetical protein